ncbi:hypothetical protein PP939_gp152 [Rhizobium phage RL38J1]|uniref:Uncharacterized protein n=1 Tax=Rhizobium phage RL38J1 TaxID=2663232 RepID=A0A6B9J1J6_9CAUD|nr:hypothetical protein PP939_gp152 [Rhizobium phage RL38J1]QGZ14094.1 hypothetical protein RL38J1_152 [Rhizobium phage RL38J1]
MSLSKEEFVQQYVLRIIQNGRNQSYFTDGMLDTFVNEAVKAYNKIRNECK